MRDDDKVQREREALLRVARGEEPSSRLVAHVLEAGRARQRARLIRRFTLSSAGLAVAAAAIFLISLQRSAPSAPQVVAEEAMAPLVEVDPAPSEVDPCEWAFVARGTALPLDDFESSTRGLPDRDGRDGQWFFMTDQDNNVPQPLVEADLLPDSLVSEGNRRAIHLRGEILREWGQTFEMELAELGCYDASAYGGIKFRAVGKARFQLAVRQIDYVPQEFDGLCESDCWNSHVKVIDSTEEWQSFEVTWDQLRRRGYDSGPLDTKRLHSVQFLVHPEDTPFDFWIDEVEFLPGE